LGDPVKVATVIDGFTDYPIAFGRQTYQDSVFRSWAAGNIAADPTDANHLAVVWSDMRNSVVPAPSDPYSAVTNSDVIVSQSLDGGQTWSAPTALTLPGDQFQPRGRVRHGRTPSDRHVRPELRPGEPPVRVHGRDRDESGIAHLLVRAGDDPALRSDDRRPVVRAEREPELPIRDGVPGRLQQHRRHAERGRGRLLDRLARAGMLRGCLSLGRGRVLRQHAVDMGRAGRPVSLLGPPPVSVARPACRPGPRGAKLGLARGVC